MIKTREKVGGVSASVYSINTGKIIELKEMPFADGTGGGGGLCCEGGIEWLLNDMSVRSQVGKH